MTSPPRKKLIEVALPLEEINKASAREKSIRHGHPSTVHLWWARRPLAACRAVIFAQLVDDPCAWPDRFPTPEAQADERKRLHNLIARMVPWEASNDEAILDEARFEIARSVAWANGEEPPTKAVDVRAYLQAKAPPVYDPFCGGGSIPLEAQRLGLRAYGSDLNPVAVLLSKALVEIPPKFSSVSPINADARGKKELIGRTWHGAQGLAEDVRYYGRWMRAEAERRIGQLYPSAPLPDGNSASVIAWIWVRTVRSPDPSVGGAHVPLASTFLLSMKDGQKTWIEPVVDRGSNSFSFAVKTGPLGRAEEEKLKLGTKSGKGQAFTCVLTGSPIPRDYIQEEGKAQRLGARLMAIVAEGQRGRTYLPANADHETIAKSAEALDIVEEARTTFLSGATPTRAMITGGVCSAYGLATWGHLFTPRQLVGLSCLSDLVAEVRSRIIEDARQIGMPDGKSLAEGGTDAAAYADAIATYLAFAVDRVVDRNSSLCTWDTGAAGKATTGAPGNSASIRNTFARQAMPMTWDFAEGNLLGNSSGNFLDAIEWVLKPIDYGRIPAIGLGSITHIDAPKNSYPARPVAISTDPPYYDNIGYSDLSDFFYVWLRRSLGEREDGHSVWPGLFRRLLAPKAEELVATPYRFIRDEAPPWAAEVPDLTQRWAQLSSKDRAEEFFMHGMSKALRAMHNASDDNTPLAIYYAFKQSETWKDGVTSAGWSTFLQAIVDAGLAIDGTWPLRTELSNRMIGSGANALASSIVLVCRKRGEKAKAVERDEFKRALRRELPESFANIRAAGVGPVDMAQAAIGPGMGIFTRYGSVLESSGEPMLVKDALKLINEVRDEIDDEGDYDLETRFAVEWFSEAQWEAKESGRAILLANAKNLAESQLERAGVIEAKSGKTRLRTRAEIGANYDPEDDKTPTVWEHAQALAYALEQGGQERAAALLGKLRDTESVRALAYRLYGICERKGWSAEALVWNRLAEEWRRIEDLAASAPKAAAPATDLFGERP